eukprot:GHRR01030211.1.p2 GENE.GHRR01030211.1~~GHRR01030211.1.p2  ORF type:complete len:136 (+),score=36.02 GHRR01030211.1:1173-1580(+)
MGVLAAYCSVVLCCAHLLSRANQQAYLAASLHYSMPCGNTNPKHTVNTATCQNQTHKGIWLNCNIVQQAIALHTFLLAEAAKLQRRKPLPSYLDRVYDTSSRCMPTSLERKLYAKVVVRKPFAVREAARLVAWYR